MRNGLYGIVVGVTALVLYWSTYVLNPAQQALVLQFGAVQGQAVEPGLQFKAPWENVIYMDKRILNLNVPTIEANVLGKKRLLVDAFARFRITNPVRFYQTVNNIDAAQRRLATFMDSALRAELAKSTFEAVVRDERSDLMERIRAEADKNAKAIGIDVVDVRIRRADLPEANSQAIFRRMQTERQREATEIRAQGEEQSRRIKSRADRDATVIVADSQRDADIIRGEGDALANEVYAQAYSKDADFFEFYRSMQAYREALASGDTSLVLSPDSEFFRYFNDAAGKAPAR